MSTLTWWATVLFGRSTRGRQLGHGRRPLVEEVQDRRAERVADRLHLVRPGERDPIGEVVVRGDGLTLTTEQTSIAECSNNSIVGSGERR